MTRSRKPGVLWNWTRRTRLYQVRLAVAFMDAHREDDAIAVLQQVLKADPGMRQAQINLVQAFAAKRMYKEALAMMAQNNANNPAVVEAQQRAYQEGGFPESHAYVQTRWFASRRPPTCHLEALPLLTPAPEKPHWRWIIWKRPTRNTRR